MATAIFLGRRRPELRVVALDGAAKIGAKILVSGGGRCNVTNARVTPVDFYGGNPNIIKKVLRAFSAERSRAFFAEIGVDLHEEEHGKLFPDSNSARSVVAALLREAQRVGVIIWTGHRVTALRRGADAFEIDVRIREPARGDEPAAESPASKSIVRAPRVVLATGGNSLPKTGSDGFGYSLARRLGHSIIPTTPALDPLVLDDGSRSGAKSTPPIHVGLSGIALEVEITIRCDRPQGDTVGERVSTAERAALPSPVRVRGPMLWTHFGVSGPAALDASRFWHRAQLDGFEATVTANLIPEHDFESSEREWLARSAEHPQVQVRKLLGAWLPGRVAEALLGELGINATAPVGQLRRDDRRRLLHALLAWPLPVAGTRGYKYAEVTAGGVPLGEVDAATMESRVCPGLHLVGEVLDADGRIGGFNFQWAWSSGFVAAHGLDRALGAR